MFRCVEIKATWIVIVRRVTKAAINTIISEIQIVESRLS